MAFSTQSVTSDGTLVLLDIAIEYFDRTEIAVLFNGIVDAYPWAWVGTTEKKISFTPAVPNTVEVMLVRTTDLASVRHIFTLGAKFTTESLDEDLTQILHIAQEARENATIEEVFHNLNMHGYRITNIGDGIDPQDAPSMAQMVVHDATIVAYRDAAQGYSLDALGYADDAAASAAAALASETNTAGAVAAHAALAGAHTIAGVSGLQAALDSKQATLVSGTNIKTVNGTSLLGSGDVTAGVSDGDKGDITVSSSGTVWTVDQKLTSATAQATTSGTSKDFTGIPSWVKRITVILAGVSLSGSALPRIQLGSGSIDTTGYVGSVVNTGGTNVAAGSTMAVSGFDLLQASGATVVLQGSLTLTLLGSNTWALNSLIGRSDNGFVGLAGGIKVLAGTLDRVRLTSSNGTDTFDAGSVNILYE